MVIFGTFDCDFQRELWVTQNNSRPFFNLLRKGLNYRPISVKPTKKLIHLLVAPFLSEANVNNAILNLDAVAADNIVLHPNQSA